MTTNARSYTNDSGDDQYDERRHDGVYKKQNEPEDGRDTPSDASPNREKDVTGAG